MFTFERSRERCCNDCNIVQYVSSKIEKAGTDEAIDGDRVWSLQLLSCKGLLVRRRFT